MRAQFVIPVLASILILGVLGSAPEAAAEPVTFHLFGEVTNINAGACTLPPVYLETFSVGDQVFGTYTFDSLAPDTFEFPLNEVFGLYAIDSVRLTVGPATYVSTSPLNNILISNQPSVDSYFLRVTTGIVEQPNLGSPLLDRFFFQVDDFSGTVFVDDSLPLTPPPPPYDQAIFVLTFPTDIGPECEVLFSIMLISFTPTPQDSDNDGVTDMDDNCPNTANPNQDDGDNDGAGDVCDAFPLDPDNDADGDGLGANEDNCPAIANVDQADFDLDGLGDVCDSDNDGDGVDDTSDNCPDTPNADQADNDGDGIGNACETMDISIIILDAINQVITLLLNPNFGLEEIKTEVEIIETEVLDPDHGLLAIKDAVDGIDTDSGSTTERVSVTINLDDIKLKTGELMVLLDTTGSGTLSTVHVAANLPCDKSGAPKIHVVAGVAGGTLSGVLTEATDNTGFDGPEKTCVFHGDLDDTDNPITDVIIINPGTASDDDDKGESQKLKGVVVTITGTYN